MKQSKINFYFGSGDLKPGASGAMYFRHMNRPASEKTSSRDLFYKKDSTVMYEEFRKKERRRMKFSTSDHMGLESDLSSQNSSQMVLNSQFNSQSSQSFAGNSDDASFRYQNWINKPQPSGAGLYRPSSQRCSSRQPFPSTNTPSQDFKERLESAKQMSREKEEKWDMFSSFLSLVKECCEDTITAVNSNTGKCDARLTEGFLTSSEKMNEISKQLLGIENLFRSRVEYEQTIDKLEKKVEAQHEENDLLRAELEKSRKEIDEARSEADNKIMEKLTDAFDNFDKGQQMQSDKIEELMTNTKSILNKPKLQTADTWCQYSPRLPIPDPIRVRNSSSSSGGSSSSNSADNRMQIFSTQTGTMPINPVTYSSLHMKCCPSNDCQPHTFAVPSILPPRHPYHGNQRCSALDNLPLSKMELGYSYVQTRPISFSSPMQPVNDANACQADVCEKIANISEETSRRLIGSPLYGFSRNKLKNSPVATIAPLQRSTKNYSKSNLIDSKPVAHTSRESWEEIAKDQSQAWFSRPNTRSRRTDERMHQLCEEQSRPENIDQPTTGRVAQSKQKNNRKSKLAGRKSQSFTAKRRKTRQTSTVVDQITTQDENEHNSDGESQISWTGDFDQWKRNCETFEPTRGVLTEQNPNAVATAKVQDDSSPSFGASKVKQEFNTALSVFSPFPVHKETPSIKWLTCLDSEDELSDDVL